MILKRYFKDNKSYYKWLMSARLKYEILEVNPTKKNTIRVIYKRYERL